MALIDSNDKLVLQANGYGANSKAIFFDGTGDYLTAPDHADWDFGTGDFCLEAWIKFSDVSGNNMVFSRNNTNDFRLVMVGSLNQWEWSIEGTSVAYSFTSAINRWYHVAFVRSSGTVAVYIDGVSIGSTANSGNIQGTDVVLIGQAASTSYFNGWMKNVRISNTARYTAAFVPSVVGFTSDSNTKLLLKAEESLHATTFTDTGNTGHTITTNGNCVLQLQSYFAEGIFRDTEITPKVPITGVADAKVVSYKFNKSAMFFNGSDSYIKVPDSDDWNFGTGAFTVEAWVMFRSAPGNQAIVTHHTDGSNYWHLRYDGTGLRFAIANGGSVVVDVTSTWTPLPYVWYHVAVSRSGNDFKLWLNGKQLGSTVTDADGTNNYTGDVRIGLGEGASTNYFNGWMKEIRISNSARYTADFTPSESQFSSDSNTKLLLHGDTPATAPLSPCIKFDGTGDYLSLASSSDWDFGTGNFTLEAWFRLNSVGQFTLIGRGTGGTPYNSFAISYNGAGTMQGWINGATVATGSMTPVANRWYHIAFVRSGTGSNETILFVDGVVLGNGTNSTNLTGTSDTINIGRALDASGLINGWLKGVRISNTARYTAAFTPSQTAFVADANTKLLILATENNGATTFVDSETSPKTITTNGDTKISYEEDYRNTIFKDDGNTGHKPYGAVASLGKIDFITPFGEGAVQLDGTGDYLTIPDHADWDLGTGAWTLEGWAKWTVAPVSSTLINVQDNTSGINLAIYDTGGTAGFHIYLNGTEYYSSHAYTPVKDIWYHFAGVRSGNSLYFWINGTQNGNTEDVTGKSVSSSSAARIGSNSSGTALFQGLCDNLRIANVARYTATFNPDTSDISGGRRKALLKAALV